MPAKKTLKEAVEKDYTVRKGSGSSGVIITPKILINKKVKLKLVRGKK